MGALDGNIMSCNKTFCNSNRQKDKFLIPTSILIIFIDNTKLLKISIILFF